MLKQFLYIFTITSFIFSCGSNEKKILIFSDAKTTLESIAAISKIASENGILVDTTTNANTFSEDSLKLYSAVVFNSTTDESLDDYQKNAFERYIQAGGGYVGVNAAAKTELNWPWYIKLVGASHPTSDSIQSLSLTINDKSHSSTSHLPATWNIKDESISFKTMSDNIKKLVSAKDRAISWAQEYDGGKSWYTSLGKSKQTFSDANYIKHILGGITYAMGSNKRKYGNAKTMLKPEANRFTLDRLVEGQLFEPTEMTILPNMDVLIAQRRGEITRYDHAEKKVRNFGKINVYHLTNNDANAEEGLMGIQKDPNYAKNGFVYIYYSPVDTSVNRLSRFFVDKDSIHMKSEKVILELYSQRQICCHTGGSIAFSGDGKYLYVSTGDNSTPFDEKEQKYTTQGYSPQDDRPGHQQYDARRSSGNTNDLRGKILRLQADGDGTFSVPNDNLFSKGTPQTRPEIYVMGNRNPYRISVDPKTGYLYWGEVGPDARINSPTRGSKGYDEVNQAKKPGFYGWPLFVGNNFAYHPYNYGTGENGSAYNPTKPINESLNNTGLKQLPAAQPAWIYYPYDDSPEFPMLTNGGRNAMAGPVYYTDMYPKESRLPDYFNGKFLMYDWIRGWIKLVNVTGDNRIESFLEDQTFSNIIDMEVAPNGEIYLLEYGKGWFSKNTDAGLTRVVYNAGNRVPKVNTKLDVDKVAGLVPFTFTAKVDALDPENDALKYHWRLGTKEIITDVPTLTQTISDLTQVSLSCTVKDPSGNLATTKPVFLIAGNESPKVEITLEGNQSMYFPNEKINYKVNIKDDATLVNENYYIQHLMNNARAEQTMGHLTGSVSSVAENIMAGSDCASCHKKDTTSIGPSFMKVAQRYEGKNFARSLLSEKIRLGGSGNWGEGAMAAHPNISETDAAQIVDWILSLTNKEVKKPTLPLTGVFIPKLDPKEANKNSAFLTVSYTDKPTNKARPLSASATKMLRPNFINVRGLPGNNGFTNINVGKEVYKTLPKKTGSTDLNKYDLFEIKRIEFIISGEISPSTKYTLVLKDKKSSATVGTVDITKKGISSMVIPVQKSEIRDFELVCTGPGGDKNAILEKITFVK
jgi:cytochrome c